MSQSRKLGVFMFFILYWPSSNRLDRVNEKMKSVMDGQDPVSCEDNNDATLFVRQPALDKPGGELMNPVKVGQ